MLKVAAVGETPAPKGVHAEGDFIQREGLTDLTPDVEVRSSRT